MGVFEMPHGPARTMFEERIKQLENKREKRTEKLAVLMQEIDDGKVSAAVEISSVESYLKEQIEDELLLEEYRFIINPMRKLSQLFR